MLLVLWFRVYLIRRHTSLLTSRRLPPPGGSECSIIMSLQEVHLTFKVSKANLLVFFPPYSLDHCLSLKLLMPLLLACDPLRLQAPPTALRSPASCQVLGLTVKKTVPGGQSEWESEETEAERKEEIKGAAGGQRWTTLSGMRSNPLDWTHH